MKLTGEYGSAIVHIEEVEQEAISQIINLLNQPMNKGSKVRIMPDVHAGAGCVIGYTSTLTDKIVPNLIGVDIGCGVTAWNLGNQIRDFVKLDEIIRKYIPSGRNVQSFYNLQLISDVYRSMNYKLSITDFLHRMEEICNRIPKCKLDYVTNSIGSLGGGNHFIEIDIDNESNQWLVIHSGSRNFGLQIALHHQKIAEDSVLLMSDEEYNRRLNEIKRTKKGKSIETAIKKLKKQAKVRKHKRNGLEYLENDLAEQYYKDMEIAQIYARLNRRVMGHTILSKCYNLNYFPPIESVHNYINFEDRIVRKGAISAHKDEAVIIPLNMADGVIIGTGKGNSDWNYSAPHGAGRSMSRSKAKENILLEEFQESMKDVWSSCISQSTIDEAPQAYKDSSKIIEYLKDTVEIKAHMKPIYNFKGDS